MIRGESASAISATTDWVEKFSFEVLSGFGREAFVDTGKGVSWFICFVQMPHTDVLLGLSLIVKVVLLLELLTTFRSVVLALLSLFEDEWFSDLIERGFCLSWIKVRRKLIFSDCQSDSLPAACWGVLPKARYFRSGLLIRGMPFLVAPLTDDACFRISNWAYWLVSLAGVKWLWFRNVLYETSGRFFYFDYLVLGL